MSQSTTDSLLEPQPLRPCTITLSHLHLNLAPDVEEFPAIILTIPATATTPAVHFRALVQETDTRCLMLESFYDAHVANKQFPGHGTFHEETLYDKQPLSGHNISHCVFQNALGVMPGGSQLNDQTPPNFKVSAVSIVPFSLEEHSFSQTFFLLDHIFARTEFESRFVAVLGQDFLRGNFFRAQWTLTGYELKMPSTILAPLPLDELIIYTSGCCLGIGTAGNVRRAGYGIHFSNLPLDDPTDWDISSPLSPKETHTKQRAEIVAVVRALYLVYTRRLLCKKFQIFTDSNYVVEGLNESVPHWREKGYVSSKKRAVANADCFRTLDMFVDFFKDMLVPFSLEHVPREENHAAEALSKAGAASNMGGPNFKVPNPDGSDEEFVKTDERPMLVLSRETYSETQPLVQWTPDGLHWLHYKKPPKSSPTQVL